MAGQSKTDHIAGHGERFSFRERPDCEICGTKDGEVLYQHPFDADPVKAFLEEYYGSRLSATQFAGGVYVIRRCRTCGFLWQGQVLTAPGIETLYEVWIDSGESLEKAQAESLSARARLAHQIALAGCLLRRPPSEIRAFDFGMGWGVWCEMARAFGFNVAGGEISARRIAHAKARGLEVVTDLLESRRAFDLINSEQVFEHIDDPIPWLHVLTKRLAPDGILRISVPDASRFVRARARGTWRPSKDAMHPLEHVNGFTHGSLLSFAGQAGLRPVGPGRFLGAHGRALIDCGAGNLRSAMEALYGHLLGVAIWFEHE